LNNSSSIKEVRLSKGLSIEQLAANLKLSPMIIEKIENDQDLPDKFKSYEKIFRNSILKSLGMHDSSSVVKLNPIPEDNTKLILTIFSFILVSTILISLSFDMYKKFNAKSKLKFIEKDQIYLDVENIMSNFHHEEISHIQFINKLVLTKMNNPQNIFQISVLDNHSIFYRVTDNKQKTINFGTITNDNPLKFDFNNDFSIDLSNIKYIDKIIVNNSIYQIDVDKPYAIKELSINKFFDLK
jgi:transcriptional regulator with XRE-family HTH domain